MSLVVQDRVGDIRADIDSLDAKIIDLLILRRTRSQSVREIKAGTGLPDTDLSRELEIIRRYLNGLGDSGSLIASDILSFSKGTT